jgi:hypothetical protein
MTIVVQNDGRPHPTLTPYGAQQAMDARRSSDAFRSGIPSYAEPVFDQWLTHHLGQLYDPVVQEPIPAELLRLLELRLK